MTFLPVALNIAGRKILLIGGGRIALQKARALLPFTRALTVLAPEVCDELLKSGVEVRIKPYEPRDLEGFFLVYACTNDRILNAGVRKDAAERGILVNVVDDPALCAFISPALYGKDGMTVAVSSGGKDVHRSIRWRDRIREIFDNDHDV